MKLNVIELAGEAISAKTKDGITSKINKIIARYFFIYINYITNLKNTPTLGIFLDG
jgi:hypothetical protein